MSANDHYLIIGNGAAGNQAAKVLRRENREARITIVSHEDVPFYSKPRLTHYITGRIGREELIVNSLDFYREQSIRLRLGQTVEAIDPDKKEVRLKHMETVHYTRLIIASGSRGRVLPAMAPYADCLQFVTGYNDVISLKERIEKSREFVIVGGDFVGFQFVKMLRKMGKKVTLLLWPHAFWPHALTDEMARTIGENLAKTGAEVIADDNLVHIEKNKERFFLKTAGKVEKEADLVFSFTGLVPDVDFARGCGIDVDRGILVNQRMETSDKNIFACGSCAQVYNPMACTYTTSIGWPNAVSQGEVAAMNLLGHEKMASPAGRKYFDLEGVKIKTTWWQEMGDEEL
ncbi:MAG: FAD-dependent oxidoreductase [Desulfobacteraceae bacterium]